MAALPPPAPGGLLPLLRAAHIGPSLAVTTAVALLAVRQDVAITTVVVLTAAVLAGQLTVGWGNDMLDAPRDRAVGRTDKPLATGELDPALVRHCLLAAALACVVLSLLTGWRSGLLHLGVGVAAGHAYNLRLKATVFSWLPYAVAFGALPAVVTLAGTSPRWPPAWMVVTAALLGVGAHVLNALPDLADDAATGVRGLPHRLGPIVSRVLATALLLLGTTVAVLALHATASGWARAALVAAALLGGVALLGRGKVPFYAAIAVALVDVALLLAAGP